ncbi:MAG: hypothetical protein ACYS0F_19285 [Planctomycetota bacterium]|jgi:hypothetical protein
MRDALNNNPMVQAGVLGVVGVVFVVLMFTTVLKKDDAGGSGSAATQDQPAVDGSADATVQVAPDPATGSDLRPAPNSAVPVTPATPPAGGGSGEGLVSSKGLPEDVLVALARRQAVALLVIDPKGISDRTVRAYTERLGSRDDVAVFVVDAKDIADYSRITQGVSVSRAPALVVIRPRGRKSDALVATVAYGFRGPKSVETALEDAFYKGGSVPSYPE